MHVAIGRFHFDHIVCHLKDRNVKGAAAEVIDNDLLVFLFIKTVRECCRGRLVDDTLYVKAGNLACIFGRLAL